MPPEAAPAPAAPAPVAPAAPAPVAPAAPAPAASLTGDPATPPAAPAAAGANSYKPEDWRHGLPDDVREDASMKSFNDVAALAKSYLHTKKMVGGDKLSAPNKHWTDDDWGQLYDKLGRPAPDKYEVAIPKDSKYTSAEFMKELTPVAHKAGILPKQLEQLVGWYDGHLAKTDQHQQDTKKTEVTQGLNKLKEEWGQAHDKRVGYAKQAIKEHGTPALVEYLNKTGLTNDPQLIKLLGTLGEQLYKENDMVSGEPVGGGLDPKQAISKYKEITGDYNHPYYKADHPKHKDAVREVAELFAAAHPNQTA